MYDATLVRFHNIDNYSEKYTNLIPYHYVANNPIIAVDIQGDSVYVVHNGVATKINAQNGKSMKLFLKILFKQVLYIKTVFSKKFIEKTLAKQGFYQKFS